VLEAVRLYPEDAEYQVQLGMTRLALRDPERALEAFSIAAGIDDQHPGVHLGLMWRRALGGALEDSVAHAERARELAPDPLQAALSVAAQWERIGEYTLALTEYRAALEAFPEAQDRIHMHLAILWARFGEDGRADAHRANAADAGDDVELTTQLVIVYASRGMLERAEGLLEEQIELHPNDPRPALHLAHLRQRPAPPAKPGQGSP
jgi:tetratricopeptide (TPR) repeat protein